MYPLFNIFLILVSLFLVFLLFQFFSTKKAGAGIAVSPRRLHRLLLQKVHFYKELKPEARSSFRRRVSGFLQKVSIVPAQGVKMTTLDKIYVACAAVIPVFRFPDWEYKQLDTVVIRTGTFSRDFRGAPEDENVLGMVGNGALH